MNALVPDRIAAYENSVVNVSGGTVGPTTGPSFGTGFLAFDNSTVNVSGGYVSHVSGYGNSGGTGNPAAPMLNLSGGAVDSIYSANGSRVNISGDVQINSLQIEGSLGIVPLSPTGFISGGTMASVAIGTNFDAYATMSGGVAEQMEIFGNSRVDISGGVIRDNVNVLGNAVLNISGGRLGHFDPVTGYDKEVKAIGNSTVNVSDGGITHITGSGNARVTATGGTVGVVQMGGNSTATIRGNTDVGVYALFDDQATGFIGDDTRVLEIDAGTLRPGTPQVTIAGGTHGQLRTDSTSVVTVSGGTLNKAMLRGSALVGVTGGTVGQLDAKNVSLVSVDGGTVLSENAYNSSATYLFSGHIGTIHLYDNAAFYWLGGTVGGNTIYGLGDTMTSIAATSYSLSSAIAGEYLDAETGVVYSGFFHDLSGTFLDGTPFATHYFEATFDSTGATYHPQITLGTASATAPESSSGWLYLFGALGGRGAALRRRYARRSRGVNR